MAARFAAEILPGIFRLDDPCVRLRLAPEGRLALEGIVAELPRGIFMGDDALGWVYQFWQKDKKDEVNASERKIGGADLGPVTQLFTEHYMVRFLLENSLGAWWASRHPDSPLVRHFDYLRRDDDGEFAAGSFDAWPDRVAEVTVMDPCCGSGHFLVEAFTMLWQMRVEEEALSPIDAQDTVLRDNLFGLELDPRCVQIAIFAVAVQAWKAGGGWRELPVPNIACSGIPVKASAEEWKALADDDPRLENALVRLHILFRDADTLGSLIDPKRATELTDPTQLQQSFEDVAWDEIAPLVDEAAQAESDDPATAVMGADATGLVRAADFLSRYYTLVATNPPYLSRGKQSEILRLHIGSHYSSAKPDLATAFLDRIDGLIRRSSGVAVVSPQNWLNQPRYAVFRADVLRRWSLGIVGRLGDGAFSSFGGAVVNVMLCVWQADPPSIDARISVVDVQDARGVIKGSELQSRTAVLVTQASQRDHPAGIASLEPSSELPLLAEYAAGLGGITTGDSPRFRRAFWELPAISEDWTRQQSTPDFTAAYTGRDLVLLWEGGQGELVKAANEGRATIAGRAAWGRRGVALQKMGDLPVTLYSGDPFENVAVVISPHRADDLGPIWHFAASGELAGEIRKIDKSVGVTCNTVVKVPFDVDRWRKVAQEAGPLPEPASDDPTQWLFEGRPEISTAPLQVAIARLVGYRWPEQPECDDLDGWSDADGIVCLPSVVGEAPAVDRLRQLLAAAHGSSWLTAKSNELLEATGSRRANLDDWLRDDFFKQHCSLFGNRPFVWHIWDGRRDGFAALANYHRLDRTTLEKLTYTYLGDWIERQQAGVRDDVAGAEARLVAATTLRTTVERILEGEPPYDINVRWKSLAEQPIGWEPDLNDGVRVNVRPFVEAGVLRSSFNIRWKKDRGTNPDGTERLNDLHVRTAEKDAVRGGSA